MVILKELLHVDCKPHSEFTLIVSAITINTKINELEFLFGGRRYLQYVSIDHDQNQMNHSFYSFTKILIGRNIQYEDEPLIIL